MYILLLEEIQYKSSSISNSKKACTSYPLGGELHSMQFTIRSCGGIFAF